MRLSITPARLVVAPGDVARVEASVINDGDLPLLPELAVRGVDPGLVLRLDTGVELAPGEVGAAVVEVQVPPDAVAGDLPFAVVVSDVDGVHESELVVVPVEVGGRPPVSVEVDPPTVHGRRIGRLDTLLRNHGPIPVDLELAGASEGADVSFGSDRVRVGAGEAVAVATRVHQRHRTWFREVRHGILIDVRGRGAPVSASTTFVQRPLFPPWLLKGTALLLILALWAGAVVAVRDRLAQPDPILAEKVTGDGFRDGETIAEAGSGDVIDGDGTDAAGDDAGVDEGGEDGAEADDAPVASVVLAGEVTGPRDPGGTRVIVEQIGFGDEGTTGEGTKIAPLTPVALQVDRVIPRTGIETDDRGRFLLTDGLATSSFYRVVADRDGFEVAAAVIRTGEEPGEYEVALELVPALGSMAGRVTGTDGAPIGGAEVLVSGGDLAYRTVTGSDGAAAGTWSIEGIAASPTYTVTFRAPQFASATILRSLEGGEPLTGVDAQLVPDRGTIRGTLSNRGDGVGAVRVDLLGEGIERSTTSLTEAGVEGTFELPALPFGTYQLTFSAPGWLTQTTEVVVDRGDVVVTIGDLQRSTATIQGFVEQEVAPGGCDYPDPAVPRQRDEAVPTACGGVGVTLVGDAGTFSTTTATGTGSFTLSSIPPGTYTAAFARFGYESQFRQVAVGAGDVLTLPDGVDGAAARVRTAAARRVAAAGPTPIVLRLVPPVTASVGQLQGVLRSAADPTATYEPPADTVVEVVGQPDAEVELLPDGTLRAAGILPGAVTVRVEAPGHDVFTTVVRVGGSVVAEAGTLLLTPLATLALRVTDSEELPIGGADVFLTTQDPADIDDAVLDATIDPTVDACAVDRDAAGRWRITQTPVGESLTGLCARVSADGDVSFRQAVGTGSYRLVTPVNQIDVAQVDDADDLTLEERTARARVVPLDHEQLERLVEVRSGETTRIDLRARRYAVIEGRIRKPSNRGFLSADVADFVVGSTNGLESFPTPGSFFDGEGELASLGIGLTLLEDGTATTPPEGLGPRLSFGPDDGLPEGVYRINRVLPSEVTTTRDYELEFFASENRSFGYRGTNALASLGFAETRSASAVLYPSPVEVEIQVKRALRSGEKIGVEGAAVSVTGIVEYVFESGGLVPFSRTATGVSDATGATVLRSDGEIQPYLGEELLDITVTGEGLETLVVEELVTSDGVIEVIVTPVLRRVSGSVRLVPTGASLPATLGGLTLGLDAVVGAGDAPLLISEGLTPTVVGNELQFEIPGIAPDDYALSVSGPGVFDTTSEVFGVPVGSEAVVPVVPPGAAAGSPFLVDAEVELTVEVTESFTAAGATGPAVLAVEGVTVRLLRNGIEVGSQDTEDGAATFTMLRGGPAYDYRVELEEPGYVPATGSDAVFRLDLASTTLPRELIRFGSVRATVRSFVSDDDELTTLDANVTVLDPSGAVVAGVPQFTSPGGDLEIPATAELRGEYRLRFEAPNHDSRTVPVVVTDTITIADATVTVLGEVRLTRTRAGITGIVTDDPSGTPLPNVRVQARGTGGPTVFAEDVTDATGGYALNDLPPRSLVLVFEEFADAASTIPTSRRTRQIPVNPDAGESLVRNLTMAREFVAISGTISSRDFDHPDAPTAPLVGATVTATCVAGDCTRSGDLVLATTTVAGGTYAFDVVNAGTYEIVVTASGHDTSATRVATVVRFADDLSTVTIDEELVATPIAVPVTADSDRFPDLANITVVATYVPADAGDPIPTTSTDGRFVLTDGTGSAGEAAGLVLPPGAWTIATTGATDAATVPRPHRDGSETLTVEADDPTTALPLQLAAYVEVSGTLRSRPHTNAASTLLTGGTAVPTPQAGAPPHPLAGVAPTTGADGAWSVLLPPTVGAGSTTWEVVLAAADHESGALDVTLAAGDGDVALADPTPSALALRALGDLAPAFHPGTGGVELTASPVAQPVLVTSAADASVLDGVTVQATWDSTDPAPPAATAYTTLRTSGTAAVDLQLAPGPWVLTTSGADTAAGLPTRAPHQDAPGTGVTPTLGATSPTATLALVRWASITGDVETVAFTGATPEQPTDATAVVTAPATGVAETGTNADGVAGQWRVWIQNPADATVLLSKDGFADNATSVTVAAFGGGRDLDVAAPVTLTAAERDVAVTVASSVDGGVTDGATLVATDPTGSLPDRTAEVVAGVATFSGSDALEPVEWRFTTTDATDLPEPHKDLLAAADVRRTIPPGTGTYALDSPTGDATDERLVLVRYASVTGTVGTRNHPNAGLSPRDGVAVDVVSPTDGVAEPLSGVDATNGRWRIWLPDPVLTTIRFDFGGYATTTRDVLAGADRDITVSLPVSMVAVPRTVALEVVSEVDGSPLVDVDVLATSSGLTSRTVTTDSNGIARFTTGTTDKRLAPATWRFTTDRADAHLPPHLDALPGDAETRPVPVGVPDDPAFPEDVPDLELDSSTAGDDDARLELERYAVVRGTVGTQAYAGAAVVLSDAPTLSVTRPATGFVTEGPGADGTVGRWRVWVPQPTAVDVDFALPGYADDTASVVAGDFSGRESTADAALVGTPRRVDVKVVSSDGSNLGDVDVIATGPPGAPGPFTDRTNGSGVASFRNSEALAPTTWTFTTERGELQTPPHSNLTTGPPDTSEDRVVPAGSGTLNLDQATGARERLTLTKYAFISGLVKTRGVDGGPETPTELATVTETTSTGAQVSSPGSVDGPAGEWQAWVPEGADPSFDFAQDFHGTETGSYTDVSGVDAADDIVLTALTRSTTVTAVASEDSGITFSGVAVTLTGAGPLPDHGPVTTDGSGVADFGSIEPIQYVVTTTGAAALGRVDLTAGDNVTLTVTPGTTAQDLELPLTLGTLPAAVTGDVVEYVNGVAVAVDGVVVTGTRGGESYDMPASTTAASDNYSLQLPAGTWRITAARATGPTVVADEAFPMPTGGTGSAPTVVMPTASGPDLTGTVTTAAGDAVEGATIAAVSGPQTRTATSDVDGDYALVGLDPGVTWAVTYTPPSSVGGVPVTRWIAPGGSPTDIALSQEVPTDYGSIRVDVTDGPPSTTVTVTLTETGPFPTIDSDGVITDTVDLDASGAGMLTFASLVPGDDVSIPHDRFTVGIDATGYESFTDTGNEVTAGATTVVDAALIALPAPTRTVIVTVSDADGAVNDGTANLTKGTSTLPGTVPTGSNVYTFSGVEADATWSLEIAGYEAEDVVVPAGTGDYSTTATVTATDRAVVVTIADADGALTGATPTLTRTGFTDVDGTESGTTPGEYTFPGVRPGGWTLEVAAYDDGSVSVPVGVGDHATSATLTASVRDVVISLADTGGALTGAAPTLTRTGFTDVGGTESGTIPGDYTFPGVRPGGWTLVVATYANEPVPVPVGTGTHTTSATLS